LKKLLLLFLFASSLYSQSALKSSVRGTVIDVTTQQPLPGANVFILDAENLGSVTDVQGYFEIKVPIGRVSVRVMYMGYEPATVRNIPVYLGKASSLQIELEQNVIEMEEITVTALPKYETANEMAAVSARSFTVEETEKYAGSRGDVARMASNFAGVSFADDSRNDIVIRGNSPAGLLWRLHGVDIPNPNHFAFEGTTGGPVGMLNNNTLSNSDFLTGAFPAEYGNALSGVFDLQMRNGNPNEYEFLGQIGFNGVELGAEGPINREHGSSFLGNYRYSTLDVMSKLGVDFGTGAGVPQYQDFSGKLVFPMQKGRIELFSLWGTSEIAIEDSKENKDDLYAENGTDLYNGSSVGVAGLSWTHFHSKNSSSALAFSGTWQKSWTDIYDLEKDRRQHEIDDNYLEGKVSLDYTFSHRFNKQLSNVTGVSWDRYTFDMDGKIFDFDEDTYYQYFKGEKKLVDGPDYWQAYTAWRYKLTDQLVFNGGLHYSRFSLNDTQSIEPRFSTSFEFSPADKISAGYGLHSRLQSLSSYYFMNDVPVGSEINATNLDLEFSKAHHVMLAYDHLFNESLRFKIEAYYQRLFDIPVEPWPSSYSMLNTGANFGLELFNNMLNDGTGENYGLELTLEQFYKNGLYYLGTLSLFDSKYKGSDGIQRSTMFDTDFVSNALVGKEIKLNEKNTIFADVKIAWGGGKRYTPIDLERSIAAGSMKRDGSRAFEGQFPDYFKMDLKVGYRLTGKRTTQEWMIYIENSSNHENVLM